jgi:FkbM family methyltransferase
MYNSSMLRRLYTIAGRAVLTVSAYVMCFGLPRGLYYFSVSRLWPRSTGRKVSIAAPGHPIRLFVRLGTTDVAVFKDIYRRREYGWEFASPPRVIVDAGAYTGLSTAFFAMRYPDAQIIAIEPDELNFGLLLLNTAGFANVRAVHAGLWTESGMITLTDPGWGAWGLRVKESHNEDRDINLPSALKAGTSIRAVTIPELMREYDLERIDLLKLDIEGSEKEIFSDAGPWISSVEAICLELHDRFKAGCSRAFFKAVEDFPIELRRGEDVLVVRERSRLSPVLGSLQPEDSRWRLVAST